PDRVDPVGGAEVRAEVDPGAVDPVQGAERVAFRVVRPLAADDPTGRVDTVADAERVGHRAAEVGDRTARAPPDRVAEAARRADAQGRRRLRDGSTPGHHTATYPGM